MGYICQKKEREQRKYESIGCIAEQGKTKACHSEGEKGSIKRGGYRHSTLGFRQNSPSLVIGECGAVDVGESAIMTGARREVCRLTRISS
jgi:hypothetical protein